MSAKIHAYVRDYRGKLRHRRFDTEKEREEFTAQIEAERKAFREGRALPAKDRVTVGDYARVFLQKLAKIRPISTVNDYARKLRLHILSMVADQEMGKMHMQQWAVVLDHVQREHGLDNATRNRLRSILHRMCNEAIRDGVIKVNPITHIERKRENPRRARGAWTAEQAQAYLEGARDWNPTFHLFTELALGLGARKAEIIALTWGKVNLAERWVQIDHIFEQESGTIQERIKSDALRNEQAGVKFAGMTDRLVKVLAEYKAQATLTGPEDLVLHREGKPVHPRLLTTWHDRLIERLGLPHIRIHDLRHTMARLLHAQTGNVFAVQEQLGHSTTNTTRAIYLEFNAAQAGTRLKGFNPFDAKAPKKRAVSKQGQNVTPTPSKTPRRKRRP